MPFMARCSRCGWLTWATERQMLNLCMQEHDIKSHRDYQTLYSNEYVTWTVTVLTEAQYSRLLRASKTTGFWRAQRTKPEEIQRKVIQHLISLISGLGSGETKPLCKPSAES